MSRPSKASALAAGARTFKKHLNTNRLNSHPHLNEKHPTKAPVILRGKRVLVVDDISTSGSSLDVARAYIEAAGGSAVLFQLGSKLINSPFSHADGGAIAQPFEAKTSSPPSPRIAHSPTTPTSLTTTRQAKSVRCSRPTKPGSGRDSGRGRTPRTR